MSVIKEVYPHSLPCIRRITREEQLTANLKTYNDTIRAEPALYVALEGIAYPPLQQKKKQ